MIKHIKKISRKIGFTSGFLVFISFLTFVSYKKLPAYIRYWHFLFGIIILYILLFFINKRIKNEQNH